MRNLIVQTSSRQRGFTIIEVAIVLLVVSVMLGYTVALVPLQRELKQYRQVDDEMQGIMDALTGFAQVNGRLPCADGDNDGLEDWPGGIADCVSWYGNVPARTIAFDGNYSQGGVLVDPWGTPYRYQVSAADSGIPADLVGDFTILTGMRAAGIPNLAPDLQVCNLQPAAHSAATPNDDIVCDVNTDVVTNVIAVLVSLGKDKAAIAANTSDIQSENLDNSLTDTVFVSTTRNDSTDNKFDDVVKWLSPSVLFSKMIAADQLP
jgi:prepilin-type N-terminal cleavage/methylation domain-containing protein